MARATDWPATPARRVTVHWSVMRPSFPAGMPKLAPGVAMRRSHATASCVPAPSAAPSTAAKVGKRRGAQTLEQLVQLGHEALVLDGGQVGAGAEVAVGPREHEHAQVARGRVAVAPASAAEQPVERLVVEGVAPLGSVDGHEARRGPACSDVDHRPVQRGARFSANAAMPSAASSVPAVTVSSACSSGSASAADESHTS